MFGYKIRNYFILLYTISLLGISISLVWFYFEAQKSKKIQNENIINIEVLHAQTFAHNIAKRILQLNKNHNLITNLEKNTKLQHHINAMLSLFAGEQYRYVYLIYQDQEGSFRYLADGSKDENQRGEFHQKFIPQLPIWDEIIKIKEPLHSLQSDISGLWITYLYPVMQEGKIVAILAMDISTQEYETLFEALKPLQKLLFILFVFMTLVLLFNFFQAFIYFKQRRKTNIDPLTKLYNRNYLYEIADNINLKKATIIMADIDFFKKINDTYGHDIGDVVLESIAKRLDNVTKKSDIVVRYGGEEFVIILQNITNADHVKEIVNRILESVRSQPVKTKEADIAVTLSLGVNIAPKDASSLKEAIKQADIALYTAKHNGRDQAVFVEPTLPDFSVKASVQPLLHGMR